jgi:hypothetical protein
VSQPRAPYSLFYLVPADNLAGVFSFTQEANTLVDALALAWLARANGENIQAIGYSLPSRFGGPPERQSILEGKALDEALDLITQRGAQPGVLPTEIAQPLAHDILAKRLARLEQIITERSGEAAVYRDLLEDLYKAAEEAIRKNDIGLLYQITGKHTFTYVPSESDVKEWGKSFLHAYQRDYGWLQFTKKALEKIKTAAEQIEASEGRDAELKQKIIKLVDDGLVPHI